MGILDGKRILVTGVTMDSSIGFAVARVAQEQGATVLISNFGRALGITRRIAGRLKALRQERGWPPLSKQQYEYSRSPNGALMVGGVQEVIDKILYEHELFGNTRFLAQASVGNVPHKMIMHSIELFGTKVVPAVKKAIETGN